jgi:hypothetical protein
MPSHCSAVGWVLPEASPVVVVDGDDDPGFSAELDCRANVPRGVVVVRPVPRVADTRRLAADVLIALGKHYDAIARERQSRHGWDLARLWARAERVGHLVVWDAHRLPQPLWDQLGGMAGESGARLWMVIRPDSETHRSRGATRSTPAELLSQLPMAGTSVQVLLDEDLVLPQESFLTFRWACMQRLNRAHFAEVDAVYLEAHRQTRIWLESRRWQDRPGREEVVRQLRAITSASRSPAETTVRLRAAQAAYFRDGVLVQVGDVGQWGHPDVPAAGLHPALAARLRRLVTPAWSCALALGAATGMCEKSLAHLKVGDLSDDGGTLTVAGESIDIPPHAAGLLRAQLLARNDEGAGDDDPLLVKAGQPFEAAVLGRRLDNAARLAGTWRHGEERRLPWHPAPTDGYLVKLSAIEGAWEDALRA